MENDFIKYLDILFKKYPTLLIQKIWRILTNNIEKNNIEKIILKKIILKKIILKKIIMFKLFK